MTHQETIPSAEDLLKSDFIERLGLDTESYTPALTKVRDRWIEKISDHSEYILNVAPSLKTILKTPEDWEEIGCYLADATRRVYGNGSAQFIGLISGLINRGLLSTKEDLRRGIEILANIGSGEPESSNYYNGAKVYDEVRKKIEKNEIKSLDEIKTRYPTTLKDILEQLSYEKVANVQKRDVESLEILVMGEILAVIYPENKQAIVYDELEENDYLRNKLSDLFRFLKRGDYKTNMRSELK